MKVAIASRLTSVREVVDRIMTDAREKGYSDSVLGSVRLALDEAIANAIRHGNRENESKKVTVDYSVGDDALRVAVIDEGSGFDPSGVPDPRANEKLLRTSGRGLLLMRSCMDQVYHNDQGNCVVLVKRNSVSSVS